MSDTAVNVTLQATITRCGDVLSAQMGDDIVLLDPRTDEYYSLEGSATRIWEIIQEPQTVQYIVQLLLTEYEVDATRCERDVVEILQQMLATGHVQISTEHGD